MGLRENIKNKRQEIGMTLEELAKRIGKTKQTVQKYESGVISNISSDIVEKLANALQTTPGNLMGWDSVNTQIGKRVENSRKNKGVSLDVLSNKTGFSVDYLTQIEKGEIEAEAQDIGLIAAVLDVSSYYLLGIDVNDNDNELSDLELAIAFKTFIETLEYKLYVHEYNDTIIDDDYIICANDDNIKSFTLQSKQQKIIISMNEYIKLREDLLSYTKFKLTELFLLHPKH